MPDQLPSRFQIGSKVRVCGMRGAVVAVIFTVIDGRNKVLYDVQYSAGVFRRVDSDDVSPASPSHLHLVDEAQREPAT